MRLKQTKQCWCQTEDSAHQDSSPHRGSPVSRLAISLPCKTNWQRRRREDPGRPQFTLGSGSRGLTHLQRCLPPHWHSRKKQMDRKFKNKWECYQSIDTIPCSLYVLAQAATTKYLSPGGLNNRHLFLPIPEARKFTIKVPHMYWAGQKSLSGFFHDI